jgi:rhomboid-like protein
MNFSPRNRSILVPLFLALNILVFVLWSTGGPAREAFMERNFLVSWDSLAEGRWWTLLTAVFSHSLFLHLLFNMLVLKSFGQVLEEILGSRFFLIFYLIAGVVSSFSHAVVSNFIVGHPDLGALGASGALAGVLLLFCLMFPHQKILLFALIPLPAIWGAIAFIGIDIWGVVAQAQGGGFPIGHGAHLGGSLCGLLCYFFYIRRRMPPRPLNRGGLLEEEEP